MLEDRSIVGTASFNGLMPALVDTLMGSQITMVEVKQSKPFAPKNQAYEIKGMPLWAEDLNSIKMVHKLSDNYSGVAFHEGSLNESIDLDSESIIKLSETHYAIRGLLPSPELREEMIARGYVKKDQEIIYVSPEKLIIPSLSFPER